jgi:YihY family inner membrane protein
MSTASLVPETYDLDGDDALQTLRRTGWGRLAKDCFLRFRYADGFSHARALAFQIALMLPPALIATVGLATLLHAEHFRDVLRQAATRLAPGPAGDVIATAVQHGQRAVGDGARAALVLGLLAALVSAATAMGQVERGANRIYGVERDRPSVRKYTIGFLLACSAGLAMVIALVLVVTGEDIAKAIGFSGAVETLWNALRWPLAAVLLVAGVAVLFRVSPRRRQPAASWLAVGSAVSVLLGFAFTWLLSLFLTASRTFGKTYGPLAGVMGVLVWAFLVSLAILLGLAFAAQLEAVRAGTPQPITGERTSRTGSEALPTTGTRRILNTLR